MGVGVERKEPTQEPCKIAETSGEVGMETEASIAERLEDFGAIFS